MVPDSNAHRYGHLPRREQKNIVQSLFLLTWDLAPAAVHILKIYFYVNTFKVAEYIKVMEKRFFSNCIISEFIKKKAQMAGWLLLEDL